MLHANVSCIDKMDISQRRLYRRIPRNHPAPNMQTALAVARTAPCDSSVASMAGVHPEDQRCMPLTCDGCEASLRSGLLAVTMYELLPDSTRVGQVRMLSLAPTSEYHQQHVHPGDGQSNAVATDLQVQMYEIHALSDSSYQLTDLCKLDCPGVFDLRWRPCQSDHHLHEAAGDTDGCTLRGTEECTGDKGDMIAATALADGSCQLISVSRDQIIATAVQPDAGCGGMTLSCDWSAFGGKDVFCSASNGMVSHCRITESTLECLQQWQAHDMETWMVTCHLHQVTPPDLIPQTAKATLHPLHSRVRICMLSAAWRAAGALGCLCLVDQNLVGRAVITSGRVDVQAENQRRAALPQRNKLLA